MPSPSSRVPIQPPSHSKRTPPALHFGARPPIPVPPANRVRRANRLIPSPTSVNVVKTALQAVLEHSLPPFFQPVSLVEIFGGQHFLGNITNEQYHSDRSCVSTSGLKEMLRSPAHFRAYIDGGRSETDAMFIGTAMHTRLLEPAIFDRQYVVMPLSVPDKRGERFKAFVRANANRLVLTIKQSEMLEGQAISVFQHPTAAALISSGVKEHTLIWQDEETGIWIKIRPDCLCLDFDTGICLDLKSTENAEKHAFRQSCINYDYDVQAALYLEGLRVVFKRDFDFAFLAMEKTAPFAVNLLGAPEEMIARGRRRFREALRLLKSCREQNEWPSYQPDGGYDVLDWPKWAN